MKQVKTVKSGTVVANTVEINPSLCNFSTFDEKTITDAGFIIKSLTVTGEVVLNNKKTKCIPVTNNFTMTTVITSRQRYNIPPIVSDFNKIIDKLIIINPDAAWSIKELVLAKDNDRYKFKVVGNSARRMLLMELNGAQHDVYKTDVLMKKLADLFHVTCFFKPSTSSLPIVCNSNLN